MEYLTSFMFVGTICVIAQVILDNTKLTPGHVTSLFVFIGAFLELGKIYDKITEFVGAGANVPIISFGHLIAQGSIKAAKAHDPMQMFTGKFTYVSGGIAFVLVLAFILTLLFKSKD